jgi:hypothetical protein
MSGRDLPLSPSPVRGRRSRPTGRSSGARPRPNPRGCSQACSSLLTNRWTYRSPSHCVRATPPRTEAEVRTFAGEGVRRDLGPWRRGGKRRTLVSLALAPPSVPREWLCSLRLVSWKYGPELVAPYMIVPRRARDRTQARRRGRDPRSDWGRRRGCRARLVGVDATLQLGDAVSRSLGHLTLVGIGGGSSRSGSPPFRRSCRSRPPTGERSRSSSR